MKCAYLGGLRGQLMAMRSHVVGLSPLNRWQMANVQKYWSICTELLIHMYKITDPYVQNYWCISTELLKHMYSITDLYVQNYWSISYVKNYWSICTELLIHMYKITDPYVQNYWFLCTGTELLIHMYRITVHRLTFIRIILMRIQTRKKWQNLKILTWPANASSEEICWKSRNWASRFTHLGAVQLVGGVGRLLQRDGGVARLGVRGVHVILNIYSYVQESHLKG